MTPAFPGPCQHETSVDIHEGMSLRDWFAGMAIQGAAVAVLDRRHGENTLYVEDVARCAYRIADAMCAISQEQSDDA